MDVQIVVPLITPLTYQLTASAMPKLAAGTNEFAAGTGEVTVVYYAQP